MIHVVTLLFMSRTLEHDISAMMSQILANVDVLFDDTEYSFVSNMSFIGQIGQLVSFSHRLRCSTVKVKMIL